MRDTLVFLGHHTGIKILLQDYILFYYMLQENMHHGIIIIKFYSPYTLRNLSSEVQQNKNIKNNCEQGRTNVITRMGEMQIGINVS